MDQLFNFIQAAIQTLIILVFCKSVIGYHFPWETCNCCKKKWKEHK